MCGITGWIQRGASSQEALAIVRRMNDALAHRGPDDVGELSLTAGGRSVGALGHRRLAILDLSAAGHQPMMSADGRYAIVFNGEIYNFRSLRTRLSAHARFVSDSDTEVILAGFAQHGAAFLRDLRGMFALAIWDRRDGRLVLARDRFGIKPLYYIHTPGGFAFSSELRALLATDRVPRRLDPLGLASYLATGSVAEPFTAIESVQMLPAGAMLELRATGDRLDLGAATTFASVLEYRSERPEDDPARAAALLRDVLTRSVEHHLVSDVPVGVFLSGGIDSAILAGLAARAHSSAVDAFTVTFAERRFDEAGPAGEVARRFQLQHHQIPVSDENLRSSLPHALSAMDQPSLDGLNTYVISRAVRDHGYKVVLSGLGGDELFAGYPSFRRAQQLARMGIPARRLVRSSTALWPRSHRAGKLALLFAGRDPAYDAYVASRTLLPPALRQALLRVEPPTSVAAPEGLTLLQTASWYELTGYMRNTLLRDADVFSMAHGLELRVPFVDPEVAAASLRVSDQLKLERGRGKAILVNAFRDVLPRCVWDRPKQGFTLPFEEWMRGSLGNEVSSALLDPRRLERVGLHPSIVRRTWEGFQMRRGIGWSRPWALYVLVRWAELTDTYANDAYVPTGPAPADVVARSLA